MRHFHTLLHGLGAVWQVLRHRRTVAAASEPADLGTAFGLDAAIEADPGSATPFAH